MTNNLLLEYDESVDAGYITVKEADWDHQVRLDDAEQGERIVQTHGPTGGGGDTGRALDLHPLLHLGDELGKRFEEPSKRGGVQAHRDAHVEWGQQHRCASPQHHLGRVWIPTEVVLDVAQHSPMVHCAQCTTHHR